MSLGLNRGIFCGLGGVLLPTCLNTGTNGAVDGFWFVIPLVYFLLVFRVDKGIFAVFADFNFVWHI